MNSYHSTHNIYLVEGRRCGRVEVSRTQSNRLRCTDVIWIKLSFICIGITYNRLGLAPSDTVAAVFITVYDADTVDSPRVVTVRC